MKKTLLFLFLFLLVGEAYAYNRSLIDPDTTITAEDLPGRWRDTFSNTFLQKKDIIGVTITDYILMFLFVCILYGFYKILRGRGR